MVEFIGIKDYEKIDTVKYLQEKATLIVLNPKSWTV